MFSLEMPPCNWTKRVSWKSICRFDPVIHLYNPYINSEMSLGFGIGLLLTEEDHLASANSNSLPEK